MQFDMIRVRNAGAVVPRHHVGLQRPLRGELDVNDAQRADLGRTSRTATFRAPGAPGQADEVVQLHDVQLVHVRGDMMVLSGIERGHNSTGLQAVDYAQTWVLRFAEGPAPQGSLGPAYPM